MSKTPILMVILFAMAANAEPMEYGVSADYYSKYVSRGQNVNDESVFQPSFYLSKYGFTGSIWANQDLTDELDNGGNITEVDYTLDYTAAIPGIDGIDWSIGVIYYEFPNTTSDSTTEVYVGASPSCTCGEADKGHCLTCLIAPSFKVYRDIDETEGTYYQFGIGHTFEKITKLKNECYSHLELGASVGYGDSKYNKACFGQDTDKINDLTLTAGVPTCFGSWTLKPSINYSTLLSDTIRGGRENNDNLWGGVSVSCDF